MTRKPHPRLTALRVALAARNMTLRELAAEAGVASSWVYPVVRGQGRSPRLEEAMRRIVPEVLQQHPFPPREG